MNKKIIFLFLFIFLKTYFSFSDAWSPVAQVSGGGGGGSGDVSGPGSSTDNAIVRWNGVGGTDVQDSGIYITDSGALGLGVVSPAQAVELTGNVLVGRMDASNFTRIIGVGSASGALSVGSGGAWMQILSTIDNDQYIQWVTHHSGVGQAIRATLDRDGNFGVGTTSPSEKLHVSGNARIDSRLGLNISPAQAVEVTSGNNILMGRIGGGAFTSIIGTGSSIGDMSLGTSGGSWIQFNQTSGDDNTIDFVTHHSGISQAVRAHIDRDGNFGIGTSSPSYNLDVVGSARVLTSGSVGSQVILENTNTNGNDWRIKSSGSADVAGAGAFAIQSFGDATTPFVILPVTNNTGIGTTSPNELLEVNGNTRIDGRLLQSKSSNSITAANDLTLNADGNTFVISGNTQINAITTNGWRSGSVVYLIFSGTPTVKHDTAGGVGTATLLLSGSVDLTAAANTVLTLVYDGTNWQEVSRKAA